MFIMLGSVFIAKISYAGTDIINTVLLKAGNVIDKVSQKYEGISVKVRELTEGKLFALDENTADMIQKAKDQKDSIQEKIDKVRAAKEFMTHADEAILDRYNTMLSQLEASDTQARDIVKQRGWTFGKDNTDDNSDDDYSDGSDDYGFDDGQAQIISKDSVGSENYSSDDSKKTNGKIDSDEVSSQYDDSEDEYYYSGDMDDDYDDSGSVITSNDNSKQNSDNNIKTTESKEIKKSADSIENSTAQSTTRKKFSSLDSDNSDKKQVDVSSNLNKMASSEQKTSPNKASIGNSQKISTLDSASKTSKETPVNTDLKQQNILLKDKVSSAPSVRRRSFTSEKAASNEMEGSNVAKN